jgi:hypothetical protein
MIKEKYQIGLGPKILGDLREITIFRLLPNYKTWKFLKNEKWARDLAEKTKTEIFRNINY